MAIPETINREQQALDLADKTGVTDTFAFENPIEMRKPFVSDTDMEFFSQVQDPNQVDEVILPDLEEYREKFDRPLEFASDDQRRKGIFERMFGYNPEEDMPWGYEKMTPFQRATMRAHLGAQNVFTRTGLGAAKQVKGLAQLVLPESMEQYLPTETKKQEFRLEEDKFYEKRIQKELRGKRDTDEGLSPEEEEQLAYMDEALPSNWQRTPEFTGRVAGEIEKIALASELFSMIPVPGGGTLNNHLSEAGRRLLGTRLAVAGSEATGKVATTTLNALSKQMQQIGPAIGELFAWGFISAEKKEGEEGDRTGAARTEAGAKMTAWAALPLLLVPAAKGIGASPLGQATGSFMGRVVSKVTGPVADKLAVMQSNKAKANVVKQGLVEADNLFFEENGRILTSIEKKAVKETLDDIVEKTAKAASDSVDDITSKIEDLAGKQLSQSPVGAESVIPKVLRSVDTVGDDIINATSATVEQQTPFVLLKQPDGNYAILDKETLTEVAVGIKRKNTAKALEDLIFGKKPQKHKLDVTKKIRTKRTIVEEAELKRSLKRMEVATNKAFRAGAKDANEKAAIKIQAGKERLQTVQAGNRQQWKNVEFARELVKDFVPKEEQHLFMNRLIKAKTEGGLDKIYDDIGKHINRSKVRNSIDSIRGALKSASDKYKDKTGKFAKAPDEIRPILESLNKSMSGINKLSQEAGADISGFGQLADDMVNGLNSALSGKGEVLGIPEGLADDLYSLSVSKGSSITADEIETLAKLTNMVIHRAEQSHMIDIGGEFVAVTGAIDDSLKRVMPRDIKPRKNGLASNFKRLYGVESDHPKTLVEKMFGQGSDMSKLLDDLYEGEVKAFGVMRNSYQLVKDYMLKNDLADDTFKGLKKKVKVKVGGKDVELARDDVLGLAMSARDPWVFDQMTKTSGYDIGGNKIQKMTTDELSDIMAMLTPEEMKLGSVMFELNNNYLSQVVNETSLHLNGFKIATYPQYYPSHRSLNKKLYGNKFAFRTAETQSNFMPRMGGKGRMKINPFSRELMDTIQNSAMYNGTATPMRSLKTVLADKGLQSTYQNAGYSEELSNFIDILSRSEGLHSDSSVLDTIGSGILNRFTKGVLGGRVSTIGTQMASVPAAKAVIPGKFFKPTDTVIGTNAIDDLMTSDFFWYRWTGRRVSVELGDTASKSSLDHFIFNKTPLTEKPLGGLVWGDKQAIGKIYLAAKRQVAATTKLAGDDLTTAAIKLTEKATRETQPNWSVLTRSKLASDPSVFKRSLTMFRTAQEAQFNIWKRANIRFSQSNKTPKDIAELSSSYKAVLESQMAVAIWKTTWKRGREAGVAGVAGWLGVYTPEDDDPFAEDLTKNAARTVAGTIPLGQIMESGIEAGYDQLFKDEGARFNLSSDPFTTVASTGFSAVSSVVKWAGKWLDKEVKREGLTADLIPATIDDVLNQMSTSEGDRAQKKQELIDQIAKDFVKAARAAGLVAGLPIGQIDEWVAPGLKRSPFKLVRRVDGNNSSDPAGLQRDLHKFLTIHAELQKKSDKTGLSEAEATRAFNMNLFKKTIIDTAFSIDDVAGDNGDGVLDSISEQIGDFINEK